MLIQNNCPRDATAVSDAMSKVLGVLDKLETFVALYAWDENRQLLITGGFARDDGSFEPYTHKVQIIHKLWRTSLLGASLH